MAHIPSGRTKYDELATPLDALSTERRADARSLVANALAQDRAMLAFQPVVQARMPMRVAFYEGLIRVLDESGRVIPAGEFIGSVEDTDLGRRLDCKALELGLATLAQSPSIRLSINMSARSIGYPEWLTTLERGLRAGPHIGERLILEITESSAILMPELVTAFMQDMQERGICFALDDFGAGYTAFRYLKDFYFDIIKIDGTFIRDIAHSPDNQILVQALVSIARHFDMFTVAEAVETEREARILSDMGLDCLQGFYFGAPTINAPWRTSKLRRQVTG